MDAKKVEEHGCKQKNAYTHITSRSELYQNLVLWYGTQIEQIESALCVILGSSYISYKEAYEELDIKTLAVRRKELSIKFAKKASKHPINQTWFIKNPTETTTRTKKPTFKPACTRTYRFRKSAIPYLTNLLNELK